MSQAKARQRDEECADERKTWSHGTFHWNELMTRDVERAKRFYGDMIGWRFEPMTMPGGGTYWCAMLEGKPVAGIFAIDAPDYDGVPESWMAYLAVDDVDKRVVAALKAGAKLTAHLRCAGCRPHRHF